MQTAKIFKSGNSQAVRLPKNYRLEGNEVFIKKVGEGLLLIPKTNLWEQWEQSLKQQDTPFMSEREQPDHQPREGLDEVFA